MQASRHDRVERYEDGEIIVREGEHGREMFIIQEGRVDVLKMVDGQELILAWLERGSFFGEMSLLEGTTRHATVRARGPVRLVVVEPGSLLLKIRRDPTFAFEMLQQMSRRVRGLDDQLVALTQELERARAERAARSERADDRVDPPAAGDVVRLPAGGAGPLGDIARTTSGLSV